MVEHACSRNPYQIRNHQQGCPAGFTPQPLNQPNNAQPKEKPLPHRPIGSMQMEVQKAPQNIQSSVVKVKPNHLAAPGQSRCLVPRQPSADGTKGEYRRPNSAKSSVWRFPCRVLELVVPRTQISQGIANTGNSKTDGKAQGQTAPLSSPMRPTHIGWGDVLNIVCH